jgi:hypothetical protein
LRTLIYKDTAALSLLCSEFWVKAIHATGWSRQFELDRLCLVYTILNYVSKMTLLIIFKQLYKDL